MVKFFFKKNSYGILNEAILFTETDVTLKVMSFSANEIAAFRWKIFLKRKLTIILVSYTDKLHMSIVA